MKKVTLAEVASKAGVSSATVSRYLKNENVRPEIAQRIHDAIEATGYIVKKSNGTSEETTKSENRKDVLRTTMQNMRFMLLTNGENDHRTNDILKALRKAIYAKGATFTICVSEGKATLEETYLTSAIVSNVDGIIVESCSDIQYIKKQMRTTAIPVIYLQGKEDNSVVIDDEEAGFTLGNYMLSKQHLVTRYISSDKALGEAHIAGIKKAYHAQKQPIDIVCTECENTYVAMFENIKETFASRIDILVLQSVEMLLPLMKYIHEYHIAVPQNVSVVCFGSGAWTQMTSPIITSLAYDYDAYGAHVIDVLIACIEKKALPKGSAMFTIQEGDSVR